MPIVNVANHFIESNGNPVDPDTKEQKNNKKKSGYKEKK